MLSLSLIQKTKASSSSAPFFYILNRIFRLYSSISFIGYQEDGKMSVVKGLVSKNSSVIKEAKAVSKTIVMKYINSLNVTLSQNEEGNFILDEIEHNIVSLVNTHLHSCYKTFQVLHGSYLLHAYLEDDEDNGD